MAKNYTEDLTLARACSAGDCRAQEKLFCLYQNLVFNLCLKIVKNPETAEDLTQDTFIQIYKKIHLYRGDSMLKTWIYRIAVNQALMFLRRDKNIYIDSTDADDNQIHIRDERNLERQIGARILLEKAIAELPEGYRRSLILFYIFGFNHEEVALIMRISPGTVKSQVFKARQKMRSIVNKKGNPRGRFAFS